MMNKKYLIQRFRVYKLFSWLENRDLNMNYWMELFFIGIIGNKKIQTY